MEGKPEIAVRIIQARVAAGYLTQRDATKAHPFSKDRLSLWENGRVEPNAEGLRALHHAYGVSVDWLLGLDDAL